MECKQTKCCPRLSLTGNNSFAISVCVTYSNDDKDLEFDAQRARYFKGGLEEKEAIISLVLFLSLIGCIFVSTSVNLSRLFIQAKL